MWCVYYVITFLSAQFYSRNVPDPISTGAYNLKSISTLRQDLACETNSVASCLVSWNVNKLNHNLLLFVDSLTLKVIKS